MRRASAVALLLLASACAPDPVVARAYDGRVVDGRFIEPAAYAAVLRGSIAEADGDAQGALAAYTQASRIDPESPEIQARLAAVRATQPPDLRVTAPTARSR